MTPQRFRLVLLVSALVVAVSNAFQSSGAGMAASRLASKTSTTTLMSPQYAQYDAVTLQNNIRMDDYSTNGSATATTTALPLVDSVGIRRPSFAKTMSKLIKIDRSKMAKMGVSFALSYSFISNINGSISLSVAWYLASSRTGLSPLVPGQWKTLLAAYAGLYAIITLMRPLRIAAAAGLATKVEGLLLRTQRRLNCSRGMAIGLQFGMGLLIWMLCAVTGVSVASTAAGVPIWPM